MSGSMGRRSRVAIALALPALAAATMLSGCSASQQAQTTVPAYSYLIEGDYTGQRLPSAARCYTGPSGGDGTGNYVEFVDNAAIYYHGDPGDHDNGRILTLFFHPGRVSVERPRRVWSDEHKSYLYIPFQNDYWIVDSGFPSSSKSEVAVPGIGGGQISVLNVDDNGDFTINYMGVGIPVRASDQLFPIVNLTEFVEDVSRVGRGAMASVYGLYRPDDGIVPDYIVLTLDEDGRHVQKVYDWFSVYKYPSSCRQ